MASETMRFQAANLTVSIHPQTKEQTLWIQVGEQATHLSARDAIDFLQWLYEHRDTLLDVARPEIEKQELPDWAQPEKNEKQEP